MKNPKFKIISREKRHRRVRKKVVGSSERPRLSIFKSLKNIYVQLVDDTNNRTILGISTLDGEFRSQAKKAGDIEAAKLLGKIFAQRARKKNISKVSFDRGPYPYHGRIKALAESAREGGLEF